MQGHYDALMTPRIRRLGIKQFTDTLHITNDENRSLKRRSNFCLALKNEVLDSQRINQLSARTAEQTKLAIEQSRAVLSRTLKQRQEVILRCSTNTQSQNLSIGMLSNRPASSLTFSRSMSSRPQSTTSISKQRNGNKISRWELKQRVGRYRTSILEFRQLRKAYEQKRKRIEKLKADQNYQEKIKDIMGRLYGVQQVLK